MIDEFIMGTIPSSLYCICSLCRGYSWRSICLLCATSRFSPTWCCTSCMHPSAPIPVQHSLVLSASESCVRHWRHCWCLRLERPRPLARPTRWRRPTRCAARLRSRCRQWPASSRCTPASGCAMGTTCAARPWPISTATSATQCSTPTSHCFRYWQPWHLRVS